MTAAPAQPETLFPPAPRCTARGCGTTAINLCKHDADIHHGKKDALSSRPRGCLNTAQNRDGIPYA